MAAANLGARVTVCEKLPEASFAGTSERSYVIILQQRGLNALEAASFTELLTADSRFLGSIRVSTAGKMSAVKADANAAGFERRQLAALLKEQAAARHGGSVKFLFDMKCVGGDLEDGSATFADASGEMKTIRYDLLVGADGQNSRVRDLLEDQVKGFQVDRQESGRALKSFVGLSPVDTLEPAEWRPGSSSGGRSLFLWSSKRAGYNLSMNRRPDGTFAGNFTATREKLEVLNTTAAARELLEGAFAGVPEEWLEDIAEQVATKPAIDLPQTIKCSQLHGPRTVLIGDAAHCVTPILGQGANAALEDTGLLAKALATPGRALEDTPAAFSRARAADAAALVDLNRYFVFATGLGPASIIAFFPIVVHVTIGSVLAAVLPFVAKPALARMDSDASYSAVVSGVVRDFAVLLTVVACIAFLLL